MIRTAKLNHLVTDHLHHPNHLVTYYYHLHPYHLVTVHHRHPHHLVDISPSVEGKRKCKYYYSVNLNIF